MSETTGNSGVGVEEEAERIRIEKEEWISTTTGLVAASRVLKMGPINPNLAQGGVRIASIWLDLFKQQHAETKPNTREDLKALMNKTFGDAVELADDEFKYPNGAPMLQVTVAAYDAFCLGFGPDSQQAARLLEWQLECYYMGDNLEEN